MKQLTQRLGLKAVAELYFTKSGKFSDALLAKLKELRPGASDDLLQPIVAKLTSEAGFPSQFYEGLHDFDQLPAAGAKPPQTAAKDEEGEYQAHETRYTAFLRETLGLKAEGLSEREQADLAVAGDAAAIDERLLQQAYRMRDEATGTVYADVSKRIYYLEQSILKRTGETREQMRERLIQPVGVTFRARDWPLAPNERLYLLGDTPELGRDDPARALPMRKASNGWELNVDVLFKRGQEVRYRLLVKAGSAVVDKDWGPKQFRKTLPNSRQVTLVDRARRR